MRGRIVSVRWIACPLAVITPLLLLPIATSESADIPTPTRSQCSLSGSYGMEKLLFLIQEEQSVTDSESAAFLDSS